MKRLRVYLSSTFEDLREYRAAVFSALEKAGLDVARMEAYTAADDRPLDLCLRDVAQSEIYLGLYAWRYGYEPPAEHGNPHGKSITELEYRQAEARKLRKLLFFAHPDTKTHWPDRFRDEVTGNGERGKKLNELRRDLSTEKSASFFRMPDELATLVLAAIMRSGLSGRPYNVPPQPAGFVPRLSLTKALVNSLVDPGTSRPNTILQGAGGFGKTTVAIDACHRAEMVNAFPDGMMWIALGDKPDLAKKLCDLHVSATGSPPAVSEIDAIAEALARALEARRCLIVVDDVWRVEDLLPFLALNGTRLLVTTRIRNLVEMAGSNGWSEVAVDEMEAGEAVALLGRGLSLDGASSATIRELADRLGSWPLLLELTNARLLEERRRRGGLAESIDRVTALFERRGVLGFDRRDSNARNAAVASSVAVGLEMAEAMFPGLAEKAAEISVFPEDVPIPMRVLAKLWKMDEFDCEEEVLRPLDNLSILRWDRETDEVRLHDVICHALGARLSEPAAVHRKLVDGYRNQPTADWSDLTDDRYILDHLAWHLERGALFDELGGLVNRRWMEAQAARSGSYKPFCDDTLRALGVARRKSPCDVPQVARCALALSTLGQLATDAPLELLGLDARVTGQRATGYISLCQNDEKRCAAYALLSSALVDRQEFSQAVDALNRAVAIAEYTKQELFDGTLLALRCAVTRLVDVGLLSEAMTAVRRIVAAHGDQVRIRHYNSGVSFVSLFARLDMTDILDDEAQQPSEEWAKELILAGELDRALGVAYAIQYPHLQVETLAEIAFHAAENGLGDRSRDIAERATRLAMSLDPEVFDRAFDNPLARLSRTGPVATLVALAKVLGHKDFVLSNMAKLLIDEKRFDAADLPILAMDDGKAKAECLLDQTTALLVDGKRSRAEATAREALRVAESAYERDNGSVWVAESYSFAAEALVKTSCFAEALGAVDQMEAIAAFWEHGDSESVKAQRRYHLEMRIRSQRDGVLASIAKHMVRAGKESQLSEVTGRVTSEGFANVVRAAAEALIATKGLDAGLSLMRLHRLDSNPQFQVCVAGALARADRFDEVLSNWRGFTDNAESGELVDLSQEFIRTGRVELATDLLWLALSRPPTFQRDEYEFISREAASVNINAPTAILVKLAHRMEEALATGSVNYQSVVTLGSALLASGETAAAEQIIRAALTGRTNVPYRSLAKEVISSYEQAVGANAPRIPISDTPEAKEQTSYSSSALQLKQMIDTGELDAAVTLARSQNPHIIRELLVELTTKLLLSHRDDVALQVSDLVHDFGHSLEIWLDALIRAGHLPDALETLLGYSDDIALPALSQLVSATSGPQDQKILEQALSVALRRNVLSSIADPLATAFHRAGSAQGLRLMLQHAESLGTPGLIQTVRGLLSEGDRSGLDKLISAAEQLREKLRTFPKDEQQHEAEPWDPCGRAIEDLCAIVGFLLECDRGEQASALIVFLSDLVTQRNLAQELTKVSVLLARLGRTADALEVFAAALVRSWPSGRKATLETLHSGVGVIPPNDTATARQICEAMREVESWW